MNVLFYLIARGKNKQKMLKKMEKEILKKMSNFFVAFSTPRPPMSVHKTFQPNRSSYTQHLYVCLSVCLSVCLTICIQKTSKLLNPQNFFLIKSANFCLFSFYSEFKEKMFTVEIEEPPKSLL